MAEVAAIIAITIVYIVLIAFYLLVAIAVLFFIFCLIAGPIKTKDTENKE